MDALLTSLIGLIGASRYGLLFFTTLLGSPVVMIGAGYLIHLHQLDFWPAYGTIVAADLVGDVGWYWAGRHGARPFLIKYGHYFGITAGIIDRVEARFLKYHEWILVISKLTMGLGVAIGVLAVAGMMRVPFWRYMALNVSGELLWALIPIGIGYYFGNISEYLPPSLRLAFVVAALIVLVVLMRYVLRKFAEKEW
jgi:membrane protein DedA with SNARE-associated domain